ncbi:MAG: cytochrome c3 family protein [Pyrinomonadaceae bacterium]
MENGTHSKLLKTLLVFGAVVAFAASCIQQAQRSPVTITSSETPAPVSERVSDKTFKVFSHKIAEHQQFECASCHAREGRSLKMEFAGHDSCIGCHLNQFTNREQVMCSICHTAEPPKMKSFPVRFIEGFNMKFDHGAHDGGKGRPPEGCSSCHETAGAGKTIPAGFQAHANCYGCHTAESKIGSCTVCHELAPYSRTPQSRYVFRAVFRHGDHAGVGCNECHSIVNGAPQSRQVTNIIASEHNGPGNNCATCHNGSRSFGGNGPNDFANCARCHKGSGFDMLPGSPGRN